MDFVRSHFGKMKLWPVEHVWLTFFSRSAQMKKSEPKVFNWSEFHFPEVISYKIHSLVPKNLDWSIFVEFRQFLHSVSKNHLECYSMAPLLCTWAVLAFSAGLAESHILGRVAICKGTACLPHLCIACGRADPAAYVCARLLLHSEQKYKQSK